MPKRIFTEDVLKEWISQGYKYVLFTDKPDEYHVLVKPVKGPEDLIGMLLYESYLLPVDEVNTTTVQSIPFIDHSMKLVCEKE